MNPEQELEVLERLIDQLLDGVRATLLSGEILTDDFQLALAQELQSTTQRIESLKAEIKELRKPGGPLNTPVSPDAQLLWVLAGQQEQAFISYLRQFPSKETQALLANPILLSQTIDQLNHMMPRGEPPTIDGIKHSDLNSSNIWGTAYDLRTGKMRVRFQGGSEYEYDDVPSNIYRAFEKGNAAAKTKGKNQYGRWWIGKNPSMGAALNQYIKSSGFNYRKIR